MLANSKDCVSILSLSYRKKQNEYETNRIFKQKLGGTALVPMLVDEDRLVSFCTFAPKDDIQPTDLSPWIGFLYTFPEYRGNKYAGMLLDYAESIATVMERE